MALTEKVESGNILYLSIVDGKFSEKVQKDTPGATYRVFTTAAGFEHHIWEILHKNLTGNITNLKVEEGKYGQQLVITVINKANEKAVVYVNVNSGYFTNICGRLPNVNMEDEVTLNPYNFTGNNGKQVTGITIYQDGSKINNFYYDTQDKKYVGLPEPNKPWNKMSKLEVKAFFLILTQFYIESIDIIADRIPEVMRIEVGENAPTSLGEALSNPRPATTGKQELFEAKQSDDQPQL